MEERRVRSVNRTQNAMDLLREEGILCGLGVYTITEVWHKAGKYTIFIRLYGLLTDQYLIGLSPSLTEAEVFDSASRTARVVAAYYHFVSQGLKVLP